jgi:hypothetical protein
VSALLWITAAVMQLAACVAYAVIGFGVCFVLLELFVVATLGLTVLAIAAHSRSYPRDRSSTVTSLRSSRRG